MVYFEAKVQCYLENWRRFSVAFDCFNIPGHIGKQLPWDHHCNLGFLLVLSNRPNFVQKDLEVHQTWSSFDLQEHQWTKMPSMIRIDLKKVKYTHFRSKTQFLWAEKFRFWVKIGQFWFKNGRFRSKMTPFRRNFRRKKQNLDTINKNFQIFDD